MEYEFERYPILLWGVHQLAAGSQCQTPVADATEASDIFSAIITDDKPPVQNTDPRKSVVFSSATLNSGLYRIPRAIVEPSRPYSVHLELSRSSGARDPPSEHAGHDTATKGSNQHLAGSSWGAVACEELRHWR